MHSISRLYAAPICAGMFLLIGCASPGPYEERGAETAPEGLTALSDQAIAESAKVVTFERQVKPILESKCVTCHSSRGAPSGYRLESREFAFARGAGGPRIVPGKPDQSPILAFASTHKNAAIMPMVGNRLTVTESKILRHWVAEGAHWPSGNAGRLKPNTNALRSEHFKMREE